ncbi:uncharacterized protein CCOS01_12140 [Colletotrichum costaricense]|uniref:MYND-type domain-containing protein n=1 Tax=Colletotrichum costaricense TaxID=1209916 RepID=A0AAJ0DWP4_9PEZI|nr:uncharacterized protein CCOS01_12140 [Colletotrichum costaricense]KAK1517883.1 hypothetical protein CCOS01_12140 [Colletotrichum costaricense]
MGRWGFRMLSCPPLSYSLLNNDTSGLFEGDKDLDIVAAIRKAFGDGPEKLDLYLMINKTDMVAPMQTRECYKTEEHAQFLRGFVTEIRGRLDSGVGDELFKKYRALEHEHQGQYRTIVVGALMMRGGAKIKADDICFHCGKIHADHGINLKKCGHCQASWYCGIDCRRTHRKIHKASCKAIWEKVLANV